MQCMASRQSGCIFCCYGALDKDDAEWQLGRAERTVWLHAAQLIPWWCAAWKGFIQNCETASNRRQGTFSILVLSRFLTINGYRLGGLPATMPRITEPCCNILAQSSTDRQCERIVKRSGTGNLIISGVLLFSNCFSCSKFMIDVSPMWLTWQCKL